MIRRSVTLALMAALLGAFMLPTRPVWADADEKQQAIEIAVAHQAFNAYLRAMTGWKADAFRADSRFNVWRVQFWSKDGEELGYAQVNTQLRRVYSYEMRYPLPDDLRKAGEIAALNFARNSSEVRALIGRLIDYGHWFDYDSYNRRWLVGCYKGGESFMVVVVFNSEDPTKFTNPALYGIFFLNVPSYAEWQRGQQQRVVTIAFSTPEVAALLRDRPGWTADAEPDGVGTGVWLVTFSWGDKPVLKVRVEVETKKVTVMP